MLMVNPGAHNIIQFKSTIVQLLFLFHSLAVIKERFCLTKFIFQKKGFTA